MSQEMSTNAIEPISPRAAEVSSAYVSGMVNTISHKIEKGQVEVGDQSHHSTHLRHNPQNSPNLKLAIREKMLLERQLGYLNKEIQREKASSAMGKMENMREDNRKEEDGIEKHQARMKEIIKREKELKVDFRKQKEQIHERRSKLAEREREYKNESVLEDEIKKKERILSKIQEIQQRTSRRTEEEQETTKRVKSLMKADTLHEKLMKEEEQEKANALQERRRKLEEIRNQHKPVDTEDILKHQQKFQLHQKDKVEERAKEREEFLQQKYHVPYESVFYKKVRQEKPVLESSDDATLKREKVKEFDSMVRMHHKPSLDKSLMEQSVLRLEKQNMSRKESPEEGRRKGLEYLSRLRSLPKAEPKPSTQLSTTSKTKYQNYLTHSARGEDMWKEYLKKMKSNDPEANLQQFLSYSEAFERKLLQKEEKSRILKQMESGEVDQKYIEMINAKLDFYNLKNE